MLRYRCAVGLVLAITWLFCVLGGAMPAHAADGTWVAPGGGDWFDETNWLEGQIPKGTPGTATFGPLLPTADATVTINDPLKAPRMRVLEYNNPNDLTLTGPGRLYFTIPASRSYARILLGPGAGRLDIQNDLIFDDDALQVTVPDGAELRLGGSMVGVLSHLLMSGEGHLVLPSDQELPISLILDVGGGLMHFTGGTIGRETDWLDILTVGQQAGEFRHSSGDILVVDLFVGTRGTGSGLYRLEDGLLNPGEFVLGGGEASGRFVQTGGTLRGPADTGSSSRNRIRIGQDEGSQGLYELVDGTLSALGVDMRVGVDGRGEVIQHAGLVETWFISLGRGAGEGVYRIEGGQIDTRRIGLGAGPGRGHFIQTGGTINLGPHTSYIESHGILPGEEFGAIYDLVDGNLIFDSSGGAELKIGDSGEERGLLRQSGGLIQAGDVLIDVAPTSDGGSRYEMSGGRLEAESMLIGNFSQQSIGGQVLFSAGEIELASPAGGELTILVGEWIQTGGSLTLDRFSFGNRGGTVSVSAGRIEADSILVHSRIEDRVAPFIVSGPTAEIDTQTLEVRGESAAVGAFRIEDPDATITIGRELILGPNSEFSAVPGATIHMTGSAFVNESDDEQQHAGLGNLTLIFEGGSQDVDPFEVAGADLGAVPEGFADNFHLAALEIGGADIGQVQLVDLFDNQPGQVEALYVDHFAIGPGSLIDLNGLNLYFNTANIDPAAIIDLNGGQLVQAVPEPGTLLLVGLGLVVLVWFGRRARHVGSAA